MADIFIGLDSSTTSSTAIAWTRDGKIVGEGKCSLGAFSPSQECAEQSPDDWWTSSAHAIRECVKYLNAADVTAIGVSTQRETFGLFDAGMKPVRPAILWYDARAKQELDILSEMLCPEAYHVRTGKQLDITSAMAKILWLRTHEPDAIENASKFADVPAYLAYRMTGKLSTPWSGVDTTGLVDLVTRDWINEYLKIVGLSRKQMPELCAPADPIGELTIDAAYDCNLRPGVKVISAGGDGHCFALGSSACGLDGNASLTLGTSGVLGLAVDEPVVGSYFRTLLGCSAEKHVLEAVIQCGSATLGWFDQRFCGIDKGKAKMKDLEAQTAAIRAGCEGLLALPYWRGARVPFNDPLARGAVVGWTDIHGPDHFRRAIMEGIALEVEFLIHEICELNGMATPGLVLGGGGANSDTWCQIFADVLGRECIRPKTVELTSLGAAICAIAAVDDKIPADIASGISLDGQRFQPDEANEAIYDHLKQPYRGLYKSTRDCCHALAALK